MRSRPKPLHKETNRRSRARFVPRSTPARVARHPGTPARRGPDALDALFPPVLLVLPEGAGGAVGERPRVHVPPPRGARRRRGARGVVAARALSRARG